MIFNLCFCERPFSNKQILRWTWKSEDNDHVKWFWNNTKRHQNHSLVTKSKAFCLIHQLSRREGLILTPFLMSGPSTFHPLLSNFVTLAYFTYFVLTLVWEPQLYATRTSWHDNKWIHVNKKITMNHISKFYYINVFLL